MAEALHQRSAGAERGQPDQDRQGPWRRSAHHLPPPGADGSGEAGRDAATRRAGSGGGGLTALSHICTCGTGGQQHKFRKLHAFLRGAKFALRLLGTVCPLAIAGCPLPQPVELSPVTPHVTPIILHGLTPKPLLPSMLTLYRQGSIDAAK